MICGNGDRWKCQWKQNPELYNGYESPQRKCKFSQDNAKISVLLT